MPLNATEHRHKPTSIIVALLMCCVTVTAVALLYLPGLGRLIFQSISARDLIVVESVVMLVVFAVILINFVVDLAYAAVDPRLRDRP